MISGDDGIEIAKKDQVDAAAAAVSWRKRMMTEGGPGHTDEVDARGLLLLISGFGIQDQVFKIQDIMDLIRASNVKGISAALRRSVFLIQKIPEVIALMVKNNLELEAADVAHAFGLEDKCHPRTFLRNDIRNIQDGFSFQMGHENVRTPESLEEIDVSNKPEQTDILNKPEEIDFLKQPEQIDICRSPEQIDVLQKPEEINTSKKPVLSALQLLCRSMKSKGMKKHITKHYSKMINLRGEISNALKLAENPAKLVLNSVCRFSVQGSKRFCMPPVSHQKKEKCRKFG
ncbi:uncharacterized protein LOC143614352 [Bidens hawaiensis]|uniref:uncharacterized protein LOC143614352 n=1 Tax=Bidens hawaiensis TaxID=980011 RepID=UPI00404A1F44